MIINRPTYFDIFAKGAGKGSPEVIILDPKGKKDSVPNRITPHETEPDTYKCEYVATMVGLHSVNVFFAGNPIPHSPFGVRVSPASIPSKVWASGKKMFEFSRTKLNRQKCYMECKINPQNVYFKVEVYNQVEFVSTKR